MRVEQRFTNSYYYSDSMNKQADKTERRDKENSPGLDTLEISDRGKELQGEAVKTSSKGIDILFDKEKDQYKISFRNSAYVYRAIKNGCIDINGKQVMLSDEMKDNLRKAADTMKESMEQETMDAVLAHNMAVLEQQAEALSGESKNNQRMMNILRRIMHGEKVSPAEENQLAKYNMEMYSLAKQAAMLNKQNNNKSEKGIEEKEDGNIKKSDELFDSPLKHLHEIKLVMETFISNNGFYDTELYTE